MAVRKGSSCVIDQTLSLLGTPDAQAEEPDVSQRPGGVLQESQAGQRNGNQVSQRGTFQSHIPGMLTHCTIHMLSKV